MGGKNGSIMLFLRNLPPNVSRRDLKTFVLAELRKAGVRGNPLLHLCANCSILRIVDPDRDTVEFHGLVEVQPARIAMQAIDVLNGKCLGGTPIEVRRYRQRSPWGERRQRAESQDDTTVVAEPLRERRRPNLKIDLVDSTPPVDGFSQLPVAS
jgi:hypothetical protein